MKGRQNSHCRHNSAKNVNIPVVASKCRVEKTWYSIVRRHPIEILQCVQYRDARSSLLSITLTRIVAYLDYSQRHLTQTIVSAVLPLILYSTYYCQRLAVEHCLFAFLHVPTVVSNRATNATGGQGAQIALTRGCDTCKLPLTRHKQQATSRTVGHNSRALLQPSWNKIVTTRLKWVMLVTLA